MRVEPWNSALVEPLRECPRVHRMGTAQSLGPDDPTHFHSRQARGRPVGWHPVSKGQSV